MLKSIERRISCIAFAPSDSKEGLVKKLQVLLLIVGGGYILAAVFYYVQAVYLGRGYPFNTFLNVPADRFTDFDNMVIMCRRLNPYNDHSRSGYPPFANLFYYPFSHISMTAGFVVFIAVPVAFIAFAIFHQLYNAPFYFRVAASAAFVGSYPMLFAFDRGNLDLWILASVCVFVFNYTSVDPYRRELACMSLAIAIAFKIYPAPLLLLFLKDRRYLDCFKTLVLAGFLTLTAASAFQGGAREAFIDFRQMLAVTDAYTKESIQHADFNAGIFYAGVIIFTKLHWDRLLSFFVSHYWLISAGVLIIYSGFIAARKLTLWEIVTCLVSLFCLTPALSNDYRLLFFIPPFILFLLERSDSGLRTYAALTIFSLLLVPKNYWHLFPLVPPGDVTFGSILNPALEFALLNIVLFGKSNEALSKPEQKMI